MEPIHELGLTGNEDIPELEALLERRFGISLQGEGHRSQTLETFEDGPILRIVLSAEGFSDDSMKGEQHVLEVDTSGGGAKVTGHGVRHKCYRTWSDAWTTRPCP